MGKTVPIDAFNPHQRSRLNASIRNGKVKSRPSDLHWTLQIDRTICVLKRINLRPLDRDRMIVMLPERLNLVRYNALIKARAFDLYRWSAHPPDRRVGCRHVASIVAVITFELVHVHDQIWWSACPPDRRVR